MKQLLSLFLLVQLLVAQEGDWDFECIDYYFENDIFSNTDSEYTDGSRFSALLYRSEAKNEWLNIPFNEGLERVHFISFSLTQQMYTPSDLNETGVIEDDRPYAGWLYLELGLLRLVSCRKYVNKDLLSAEDSCEKTIVYFTINYKL